MAYRDLGAFLADDALEVPVDGKVYRIASPDAKTGLWLTALANLGEREVAGERLTPDEIAALRLDDGDEQDFIRKVLGRTVDELVADGVSWVKVQRISRYAFYYFAIGPEAADHLTASGALSGEARAPRQSRAARRQASQGGATTTTAPASTGGTTSRRKRKRKPKAT